MFKRVTPVVDHSVRDLCGRPYYNHPKGCPNLGKNSCPPLAPLIEDIIYLDGVYVIYNIFDFRSHCDRMRQRHPEWSLRQIECCLYWQPKARKQLKEEIKKFKKEFPDYIIVRTPEACGVDLTATMKSIGIELEWPPVSVTYQIVLAGKKVLDF